MQEWKQLEDNKEILKSEYFQVKCSIWL